MDLLKLVETAIRLDHYDNPTADKLIRFGTSLKNNEFSNKVLRRLVADYLNYFEVVGAERQKLAKAFNLSGEKDYLFNVNKSERDALVNSKNSQKFTPPEK